MEKAGKLAKGRSATEKTVGVLPRVKRKPLSENIGDVSIHKGRSPGHQLAKGKGGKEKMVTPVADPEIGIAAREVHRGNKGGAITTPAQMDLKKKYRTEANAAGVKSTPKHYESFTTPAGNKAHMSEWVEGKPPTSKSGHKAAKDAIDEQAAFADKRGYEIADLTSRGNTVVRKAKGRAGHEGVALDPIVHRKGGTRMERRLTADQKKIEAGKRKGSDGVAKDNFDPSKKDLDSYSKSLDPARKRAQRVLDSKTKKPPVGTPPSSYKRPRGSSPF